MEYATFSEAIECYYPMYQQHGDFSLELYITEEIVICSTADQNIS